MKVWVYSLVLLLGTCTQVQGQRFRGAYGYSAYGGYLNQGRGTLYGGHLNQGSRSGNTLYGGVVPVTPRFNRGASYGPGRYNVPPSYARWRSQYRNPYLDRARPYTLSDLEWDMYWYVQRLERAPSKLWDEPNLGGRW